MWLDDDSGFTDVEAARQGVAMRRLSSDLPHEPTTAS
jgi:hypothetical protein